MPYFPNCTTCFVKYNALNSWFVSLNVIRAKNRYLNIYSAWDSIKMNSPTYAQPFLKSIQTMPIFLFETAGRYVDRSLCIPFHRRRQKNKSPLFLCLSKNTTIKKIHPCCQRLCLFQCHRYMHKQRHFLYWYKEINNFPNLSCQAEKTIIPSPTHTHLIFSLHCSRKKALSSSVSSQMSTGTPSVPSPWLPGVQMLFSGYSQYFPIVFTSCVCTWKA